MERPIDLPDSTDLPGARQYMARRRSWEHRQECLCHERHFKYQRAIRRSSREPGRTGRPTAGPKTAPTYANLFCDLCLLWKIRMPVKNRTRRSYGGLGEPEAFSSGMRPPLLLVLRRSSGSERVRTQRIRNAIRNWDTIEKLRLTTHENRKVWPGPDLRAGQAGLRKKKLPDAATAAPGR